jgi:hypothetical protein
MERSLVPLNFSPIHASDSPEAAEATLRALDSSVVKLKRLYGVLDETLEAEVAKRAHAIAEHVLTYLWS